MDWLLLVERMLVYRFLLAIVISIGTLLIAGTIDMLFAPMPLVVRVLFQIPILIILIDEGRRWLLANMKLLTEEDINGCFFFAAPMAAFGSFSLFTSLEGLRP